MKTQFILAFVLTAILLSCSTVVKNQDRSPTSENRSPLGAIVFEEKVVFRIFSSNATRMQLEIFDQAYGTTAKLARVLEKVDQDVWQTEVSKSEFIQLGIWQKSFYYGYRAWGPNWKFDSNWQPGSSAGFVTDVDSSGNRFNPNKLLTDPYALEISHDPVGLRAKNLKFEDKAIYTSGIENRNQDSATVASKGIVLFKTLQKPSTGPQRQLKDDVVYEVHVRGFTMNDPTVPLKERGTYAGAARKAKYLKSLGVTAVEFLPVQETQNDQNDLSEKSDGDNYWGYMTLNYFSPDRRYSSNKLAGGPSQEFANMVDAFHKEGIKVFIDVVYNHTGEGGLWNESGEKAELYSFRGLDNSSYYLLPANKKFYWDSTGCGNTFNSGHPAVANLIVDSLKYWKNNLGVDGFRFDLAATLANSCTENCFRFEKFDSKATLNRIVNEVPSRMFNSNGADIIAEAWAIGLYEVGNFPWGWAEWNGPFRDTFRKSQNLKGIEKVTPADLANAFSGSSSLFQGNGRNPTSSVNFLVAHDGFTLRDLYSYNQKMNNQAFPFGPSDGGEDNNRSWDQGGDPIAQRQAARTGMAILMLSSGVPMITGGDEFYRTQYGNNNAYNLDTSKNWLDWSWQKNKLVKEKGFFEFSKSLLNFRNSHSSLRRENYFTGQDQNGNGIKDIQWFQANGSEANGEYMNSSSGFLAFRIDSSENKQEAVDEIFVAYNSDGFEVDVKLPNLRNGKKWYRIMDTAAWFESNNNFETLGRETAMTSLNYKMHGRSVLVMVQK